MAWGLASPQIFWLLVSSYLSNPLFIIVFYLGLRSMRKQAIVGQANHFGSYITILAATLAIFSFYPSALPITLCLYLAVETIYAGGNRYNLKDELGRRIRTAVVMGAVTLTLCVMFQHQIAIDEVQRSLNPLIEHGANFVPLNPWSLLQEKPKPMPIRKDFGVWINLAIGVIFSALVFWRLWGKLRQDMGQPRFSTSTLRQITSGQKDLLAACFGIGFYATYLIAYILFEYTYRLGKVAISFLWPLGIFALPPLFGWFTNSDWFVKNWKFRQIAIAILAIHMVLHVGKSFDQKARPSGTSRLLTIQN
ncbi:MAG: hypothetical protein AAFY11_12085 [Cyanobacteria bacterium J06641_5]